MFRKTEQIDYLFTSINDTLIDFHLIICYANNFHVKAIFISCYSSVLNLLISFKL